MMNTVTTILAILCGLIPIFNYYFIKKDEPGKKTKTKPDSEIKCKKCGFENDSVKKYCAKCSALL